MHDRSIQPDDSQPRRRPSAFARGLLLLCLSGLTCPRTAWSQEAAPLAAKKPTFEDDVAPILKEHCWKCHAGSEPKQGLRLTSRREILAGGESGPAIRIASAESSLLWEKIASNEMPAAGPPLTAAEKGVLRSWINEGALGSEPLETDAANDAAPTLEQATNFWSFLPPARPDVPSVQAADRVRNPIDAFILEKLEARGLHLSSAASREVLLRRAYFDLIGMPPPPDAVREFLADNGDGAYERMIEQLLASPHYGERWGRHWLDLAGYADSAGVLSEDRPLPTAFHYRNYVIQAFNADKPYDRFLLEQLAGDELTDYWAAHDHLDRLPDDVIEAIVATGYLRCAPDCSRPDFNTIKNADAQYYYPTLFDTLQIVGSSTMGLTVQCARCHSHKYDPIPQVEYYRLQSIFMTAFRPRDWIPQMERELPIATASQKAAAKEHNGRIDAEVARLTAEQDGLRQQFAKRLFDERLATLPDAIRADVAHALDQPAEARTAVEKYLAEKFQPVLRPEGAALDNTLSETYADYKTATDERSSAIAAQQRQRRSFDQVRALYDLPGDVTTPVLRRGDALTPGPPVEPGVISALRTSEPFVWTPPAADAKTSGRRLAFARWLTQPDHPLTARVMVNRIWLLHFGEGIVSTPADFGAMGAEPSHPELLDWLAREFVEHGWSIKHLHRLILSSSTWRQQSLLHESEHALARQIDPDNRLLWRQRMRRLDAESVRDAILACAGLLDRSFFGNPIPVARRRDGEVTVADGENDRRRSVYIQVLRGNPLTMLQAFDQPVMETNCTRRSSSTVSTQALTLLNSDTLQSAATALADRVLLASPNSPIASAILTVFSRTPNNDELALLSRFVEAQRETHASLGVALEEARRQALVDLCHMLLSANEFVYLD